MRPRGWAVRALLAACLVLLLGPSPQVLASPAERDPRAVDRRSGLPWSSGVTPVDIQGAEAARFGRRRGAPVDNVGVYPGRQTWETLLSTFWTRALPEYFDPGVDDLVVALPLWPSTGSVRHTGSRAQWLALGTNIGTADPDAYVRLGWEMNVDDFYWALRPGNRDAWVPAFKRAARLILTACPRCQIVWNPNHGTGGTGEDQRRAFLQVKRFVDVYAIDDYDIYPPIKDAASRREHMNEYGRLNESYRFARRHRMKFAVPEWGIACNGPGCQWRGAAGGDNPYYVRTFVRWFASHARHLAFETYFDEPQATTRSALYTRPIGPLAGRAYRAELRRLR